MLHRVRTEYCCKSVYESGKIMLEQGRSVIYNEKIITTTKRGAYEHKTKSAF